MKKPGPPSLVLFDFNGVLVDDETFHFRALRETVGRLGVGLTRRDYDTRYMTGDDAFALRAVLRDARIVPSDREVGALVRRKRASYRRLVGGAPTIDPRIARLVRGLARRATLGIVSSGARREIEASLAAAGVRRCFATIVAAGEVPRAKPHPDPYLRALSRLRRAGGDRPEAALVIEDSAGGIASARAAGVRTILGVATTRPAPVLRRAGALQVVPSLTDLTVSDVLGLSRAVPETRRRILS
jgi:beta-phosphoglucomutase